MTQNEIDSDNTRAYERSVAADHALSAGRVEEGRRLMAEAAALSATYAVRAELFGIADTRKIQVSRVVRRTIVPFLKDAGFTLQFGDEWSDGAYLIRRVGDVEQSISIGRDKFGHQLGVTAACWRDPAKVEHFSWRPSGMRSGSLAYKTQRELEVVCERWCKLMSEHLWPWFDQYVSRET